jgi:hypothetical protein
MPFMSANGFQQALRQAQKTEPEQMVADVPANVEKIRRRHQGRLKAFSGRYAFVGAGGFTRHIPAAPPVREKAAINRKPPIDLIDRSRAEGAVPRRPSIGG